MPSRPSLSSPSEIVPVSGTRRFAANINSYQMQSSFGAHETRPGAMMIHPMWGGSSDHQEDYGIGW